MYCIYEQRLIGQVAISTFLDRHRKNTFRSRTSYPQKHRFKDRKPNWLVELNCLIEKRIPWVSRIFCPEKGRVKVHVEQVSFALKEPRMYDVRWFLSFFDLPTSSMIFSPGRQIFWGFFLTYLPVMLKSDVIYECSLKKWTSKRKNLEESKMSDRVIIENEFKKNKIWKFQRKNGNKSPNRKGI